jgi:hypothetical protein
VGSKPEGIGSIRISWMVRPFSGLEHDPKKKRVPFCSPFPLDASCAPPQVHLLTTNAEQLRHDLPRAADMRQANASMNRSCRNRCTNNSNPLAQATMCS